MPIDFRYYKNFLISRYFHKRERREHICMLEKFDAQFDNLIATFRLAENEQKKRYNDAIDIEDMAEATAVTIDARTKIQQIRKFIEELSRLKNDVGNIFSENINIGVNELKIEFPVILSSEIDIITDHEETKIGVYVRSKLRDLCDIGFQPTSNQVNDFVQKKWSKENLNLNYPFARIYNPSLPLHDQLSDENGKNRQWSEIFDFGEYKLLFCNQWYKGDREYFDNWYKTLSIQESRMDVENIIPIQIESVESLPVKSSDHSDIVEGSRKIKFLDKSYGANTWKELLIMLCELIVLHKPYVAARFGIDSSMNSEDFTLFSFDESKILNESKKLSNGLYVDVSGSDTDIKLRCEHIIGACGYNYGELQIN